VKRISILGWLMALVVTSPGCLAALFGGVNPLAVVRTVQSLMELRGLSQDELIERLSFTPEALLENAVYGRLEGLTRLYDAAKHPAQFFYQGQELAMAVIEDPSALAGITARALTDHLGAPPLELPTALGEAARLAVYPSTGLAFAFTDPAAPVGRLEVFPATTPAGYEATVWRAPAVPDTP